MGKEIGVRVQGQDRKVYYRNPDSERIRMYYEYTEDNFRKGKDYNLEVYRFSRVAGWRKDIQGILLQIEGDVIKNTQVDSDGELRPVVDESGAAEHFQAFVRVGIYSQGIFRMTAGMGSTECGHHTVMLEGVAPLTPDTSYTAIEKNGRLWIETDICKAAIGLEEFGFELYDESGRAVYRQANDDQVLRFTYESFPFGFVHNPETEEWIAVCSGRMENDESFYGFGEQYSPVDKKMQEVDVFITDPLSVGTARTYVSLPFYFSSRGYGMYVNTHFRSKFFMGNRSNRSTSCHIYGESVLDIFYIYGENPKNILRRYTDITGKSPALPRWSFGLWMSRCSYQTEDEVLDVARKLRERDIPCDVINIDTDWSEIPWACDWKFGSKNFPHPQELMETLKKMGIKTSLWQKPYITIEHLPELTEKMLEKGWIPLNRFGEPARSNPVIDLSNPECCEWYKQQLVNLHKMGADVIKTDMGEGVPVEGGYSGYEGKEIRNIYPYLYSRAAYEAAQEAGVKEPVLWGRSTYAGGQKYPLHWAGDPFADFDGLRFSIRSGLSMGMSGFTYWSHDIGGFLGRPTEEVYIRWMQAGMFCSHARCHGVHNPREPWTFGERAENIFRRYDKLRYRLIPYIYSMACERGSEGLPMMEHLYLSSPTDRNCRAVDDEWMFGDAFLVAPILNEGGVREVYFPEGTWNHFFSGEKIEGRQYLPVKCELDDMPLYVKSGSIIPNIPEQACISEEQLPVTLDIYYRESGETVFPYYEKKKYLWKVVFEQQQVRVDLGDFDRPVSLRLIGKGQTRSAENILKGYVFYLGAE